MLKSQLDDLIKNWLIDFNLYAPVKINGQTAVQRISLPRQIDYSAKIPINSYKHLFLPNESDLFEFNENNSPQEIKSGPAKKTLAWAMNILDLKALTLYEQVFAKDPYYQANKRNTVVCGFHPSPVIDNKKFKTFSLQFEESVLEHLIFDIFLIKQGNDYRFFTGSEKGQKILEKYNIEEYAHISFAGLIPEEGADPKAKELYTLVNGSQNNQIWEELGKICLACGKCSAVCPTCFCFDLRDENQEKKVVRKRCQATCFNSDFGLVAGPYNFQNTIKQRIFFWYMHKFVRIPKQYNFAAPGCVSCMRCAAVCPVGINIKEVLKKLKKDKKI